jgi:hypothetical protein
MQAIGALFIALSFPIMMLNMLGGVVGGIWLIVLGIWTPIIYSVLILFFGHWVISLLLMPGMLLLLPAAQAADKGWNFVAVVGAFLNALYTGAAMTGWAYWVMKEYSAAGPESAQWPILLLGYGAATGSWAYMASKEHPTQSNAALWVFFLSLGYIIAAVARLFAGVSFSTCFWIIAAVMAVGLILQLVATYEEQKALRPLT